VNKLLEARHSRESSEVSSPPVTPISLADVSRRSTTETAVEKKRIKGKLSAVTGFHVYDSIIQYSYVYKS
jgi:hypothetical protein